MQKKRAAALAESAKPYLEQGETVRGVFHGQTFVSPILYLLVGPIVFMFMARQGAIITTDRDVYQFKLGFWSTKKVENLLHKTPLASAHAEEKPFWSLEVGEGPRLYAFLGTNKFRKEVAAQINGGEAEPAFDPTAT
jgi:hypothetical protein